MMPSEPSHGLPPAVEESREAISAVAAPVWYQKASAILFITFCLEIGLFLLVFPWLEYWDTRLSPFVFSVLPAWQPYVDNMYVRGAISGLGVVNVYISFLEIFRLRRFSRV